jgi:hypothetical protein
MAGGREIPDSQPAVSQPNPLIGAYIETGIIRPTVSQSVGHSSKPHPEI